MTKHAAAELIWNAFCSRFSIAQKAVPLFATQLDGTTSLKTMGKTVQRQLLMRSPDMETMVRTEVAKLVADHEAGTHRQDGLIYMMGTKQGNTFVPLYIGKTETLGIARAMATCRPTSRIWTRTPASSPAGVTTTRSTLVT